MSDLNDFFAKKDRKKKRAAAAKSAPATEAAASVVVADAQPAGQKAPPSGQPVDVTAPSSTSQQSQSQSQSQSQPQQQQQQQPKQDDGWIEIEDVRGSQVNTGGRTVGEFRRDAEEKEANGESAVAAEKFSGWKTAEATEPEEEEKAKEEEEKEKEKPVLLFGKRQQAVPFNKQPASAFPTLADAAKVRQVAPAQAPAGAAPKPLERQRPRLVFDKEKLRKKLEENAKQGA